MNTDPVGTGHTDPHNPEVIIGFWGYPSQSEALLLGSVDNPNDPPIESGGIPMQPKRIGHTWDRDTKRRR